MQLVTGQNEQPTSKIIELVKVNQLVVYNE